MFAQETTTLLTSALTIIFYLVIAFFTFSSAIALYSLIRYGKDRIMITSVTITYIVIATTLFFIALGQLKQISL